MISWGGMTPLASDDTIVFMSMSKSIKMDTGWRTTFKLINAMNTLSILLRVSAINRVVQYITKASYLYQSTSRVRCVRISAGCFDH